MTANSTQSKIRVGIPSILLTLLLLTRAYGQEYPRFVLQTSHGTRVTDAEISPDGTLLAVLGDGINDNTVKLWNLQDDSLLTTVVVETSPFFLQWHPSGGFLTVLSDDEVTCINKDSGKVTGRYKPTDTIGAVGKSSWSAKGKYFPIDSYDTLTIISQSCEPIKTLRKVRSWHWNPTNNSIAVASGRRIDVYDAELKLESSIETYFDITELSWNPSGDKLAFVESGVVQTWKPGALGPSKDFSEGLEPYALSWTPDGRQVVVAGKRFQEDSKLYLLNPNSLEQEGEFVLGESYSSIRWEGKGRYILVIRETGLSSLSIPDGKERVLLDSVSVADLRFNEKSGLWAVGTRSDGVFLCDREWQVIKKSFGTEPRIGGTVLSGSGKRILQGPVKSHPSAVFWNLESGEPSFYALPAECEGRTLPVWSPDSTRIAVVGPRHKILIFDSQSGALGLTCEGATDQELYQLAWSPDGKFIAGVTRHPDFDDELWVWDSETGETVKRYSEALGYYTDVAWSPDSRFLATANSDRAVRIHDGQTALLRQTLGVPDVSLQSRPDSGDMSNPPGHKEKVEALSWRPDGQKLASCGADGVFVWDIESFSFDWAHSLKTRTDEEHVYFIENIAWSPDGKQLAVESGSSSVTVFFEGGVTESFEWRVPWLTALAFSRDGSVLATGSSDGVVRFWRRGHQEPLAEVQAVDATIVEMGWLPQKEILFASSIHGLTTFIDTQNNEVLASILSISDGREWVAFDRTGFFDGTPKGWESIKWQLSNSLIDQASPELFFQEFFQPGLLRDVLSEGKDIRSILRSRGDTRASLDLTGKDRVQPLVKVSLEEEPSGPNSKALVRVTAEEGADGSGLFDLRLFRNGILVGRWPGELTSAYTSETLVLPLAPGKNEISAYAFNGDNVKSANASLQIPNLAVSSPAKAHLLQVGIDKYEGRPDLALSFATKDAIELSETLGKNLPVDSFNKLVLTDAQATKSDILTALRGLAKLAKPQDIVIVSYSGHGFLYKTDREHFYLVPHDVHGASSPEELASRSISDEDLSQAFLSLQAEKVVLILDACHSGGALDTQETRRGPLNARGLAQLAYEKKMEVITASQAQEVAREDLVGGGYGLLTFALLESLERAPRDGRGCLSARQWLDFAAEKVAGFSNDGSPRVFHLVENSSKVRGVQTPRVFHRRLSGDWAVSGGP